ncbi:unnamed protein product [Cutaneotrichosporon oleaginosum]
MGLASHATLAGLPALTARQLSSSRALALACLSFPLQPEWEEPQQDEDEDEDEAEEERREQTWGGGETTRTANNRVAGRVLCPAAVLSDPVTPWIVA